MNIAISYLPNPKSSLNFGLLGSNLHPWHEEKKTKARQGFGPEGKHVLTDEEEARTESWRVAL